MNVQFLLCCDCLFVNHQDIIMKQDLNNLIFTNRLLQNHLFFSRIVLWSSLLKSHSNLQQTSFQK